MQIESANFDVGVVTAMKTGKNAIQNFNKQINVDDIADLKDDPKDVEPSIDFTEFKQVVVNWSN